MPTASTASAERASLLTRARATATDDEGWRQHLDDVERATTTTANATRARRDGGGGDAGDARRGGRWTRARVGAGALAACAAIGAAAAATRDGGLGASAAKLGDARATRKAMIAQAYYRNAHGKVDQLAVAAALDPIRHAYLPDAFRGYDADVDVSSYAHAPAVTRSETGFTMCVDMPADAWDSTYVKGFGRLFTPGACVEKVVIGCDGDKRADVRVFSQSGYLWRGKNKGKDGSYAKPAKIDPGQVDVYMAHEAVATFGKDLQNPKVVREFDYVGYFDQKRSAIWWPFGPSLDSMAEDFPAYTIPHSERIPAVAWIAIDCLPPRPGIIVGLAEHFPTFSMGNCFNNYHLPRNLPGRGVENLEYQSKMARYMFYFAVENAPMCEGYMTEKVWMALARGSIPIYTGHDSFTELMPTKKSYIDLRDYDSFEALAAELEAIASDESRYNEYTSWRYDHPSTWSPGFRKLLRVQSTDIKAGLCAVLAKGPTVFPKADKMGGCSSDADLLGVKHGDFGAYIEAARFRSKHHETGVPRSPLDFLQRVSCKDEQEKEFMGDCFVRRDAPVPPEIPLLLAARDRAQWNRREKRIEDRAIDAPADETAN